MHRHHSHQPFTHGPHPVYHRPDTIAQIPLHIYIYTHTSCHHTIHSYKVTHIWIMYDMVCYGRVLHGITLSLFSTQYYLHRYLLHTFTSYLCVYIYESISISITLHIIHTLAVLSTSYCIRYILTNYMPLHRHPVAIHSHASSS